MNSLSGQKGCLHPATLWWASRLFLALWMGLTEGALGDAESNPPQTNGTKQAPASTEKPMVPPGSTNRAPSDAFVLRRWELIPPAAPPRVVTAQFPITSPMISIESMVWTDGRLWIAARLRTVPQVPTTQAKLWMFNPDDNRLGPVPGLIEKNEVSGMMGGTRRLWLALEGGAGTLDTQTLAVEPFGAAQGLTVNHIAGLADAEGALLVVGRSGATFRLSPTGTNFIRSGGLNFPGATGGPEPWHRAAASRQWLLAFSDIELATRHVDAPQWTLLHDELSRNSPRLERPHLLSVEGDGEGGFWIGSDAGLHWVRPEDGTVENRFMTGGVFVPGGLGIAVSAWHRPTATAYSQARQRVMAGIRERMRQRAQFARLSAETHSTISPVLPTSRIPGEVTAILRDKSFLWIASTDGRNTNQSRILLYQPTSRKWMGWFSVPYPVRCMAANERVLFLGLEVPPGPHASPLVAVEKFPLTAIPASRWVDDEVTNAEVERRIAAIPPRERNVFWFFSGQPQRILDAVAPEGHPDDNADAETLFLLTFACDVAGLDEPDKFAAYSRLLLERFPESIYAELARGVLPTAPESVRRNRSRPTSAARRMPARADETTAPSETPVNPETVTEVLARRDLDGDGKLNLVEFQLWKGESSGFKTFDTNQDGFLDASEIESMMQKH